MEAEAAATASSYDLLILDSELPGKDGLTVLENLRKNGNGLPVLILTARDTPDDRIRGLDLGVNDYLGKPFTLASWRLVSGLCCARTSGPIEPRFVPSRLCLIRWQTSFPSTTNLGILAQGISRAGDLIAKKGRVVFKNDLMQHLSLLDRDMTGNALDIVIHRLRKKIDDSGLCNTHCKRSWIHN